MNETQRATARKIAHKHLDSGDPLVWFEDLYSRADEKSSIIPWAFEDFMDREEPPVRRFRATYYRKP